MYIDIDYNYDYDYDIEINIDDDAYRQRQKSTLTSSPPLDNICARAATRLPYRQYDFYDGDTGSTPAIWVR